MHVNGVNYFIIDLTDVCGFNYEFGTRIIKEHKQLNDVIKTVIRSKLRTRNPVYADSLKEIQLLYTHHPLGHKHIHEIYLHPLYELIETSGIVVQIGAVMKRPTMIAYSCPVCGELTYIDQTEQWRISPDKCRACDNRKGFTKAYEESSFANYQWIEIQELTENTPNGATPATIKILLKNNLTKTCSPGEIVTITGEPKVVESSANTLKLEMEYYIDAVGVNNKTEEKTIDLSQEDIEYLKTLPKNPEYLKNVIKSYAPTIYGEEAIKEALIYQQCEGVEKQLSKQKRRRGQIHILLAGPPGVAKSDFGEYQALYHTKGRIATGRGTSSAGLTASVVKENEEWVLKAGAMALADRGLLFVDEIEKMRPEDSGAMHPGMEAQQIPIAKAGINATIMTRCSIIAACNPVNGEWNNYATLAGNLIHRGSGLTVPLLNRFALIFIVKEKDTEGEESEVIEHILKINQDNNDVDVIYDEDVLRKLFSYARTIKPRLTKEASMRLKEFYMTLFSSSKKEGNVVVSRRQIEDLIRISEASAKLHLREEVTVEDAERAVKLLGKSLKQYGVNPDTGKIDPINALYGESMGKREMIQDAPKVMKRLCERNIDKSSISRVEFVDYASKTWHVTNSEVGEILNVLLRDGTFQCPTPFTLGLSESLQPTLLNTSSEEEIDDTDE